MIKSDEATTYRNALVLDVIGAIAVTTSAVMSFRGPLPVWAQVVYLVGCMVGMASTFLQRNYFSVVCFLVAALIAVYQLVGGA